MNFYNSYLWDPFYQSYLRPVWPQFTPQFGYPADPPPGIPPSGPTFGPPSGPTSGPPSSPPSFTPQEVQAQSVSPFAVESGAIRLCTFRYVYIWLRNGQQFWAWLVFVGRTSAAGWRWTGFRWVYFGISLREIRSFICY